MTQPMTYWSITSQVMKEEAEKLWLEVEILVPEKNFFLIRGNGKEIIFKSNDFGGNSSLAKKIVDDKELSYVMLDRFWFPIAKTWYLQQEDFTRCEWAQFHDYLPLVIKPIDEWHGNGVMVNITTIGELQEKLKKSFLKYPKMIIQTQIYGDECRVVVLFGKVIVAYNRIPPKILGDGKSTIEALIHLENTSNPLRDLHYTSPLSYIRIDDELDNFIEKQWYKRDVVLEKWTQLQLRWNSNVGTWWTIYDITASLHPSIAQLCSEIAKKMEMQLLCIDIMATDFTKPLHETKGVILEMWGNPGFGWHRELTSVNTARILLTKLFFT